MGDDIVDAGEFVEWLKYRREAKGWSVAQVAEMCGVSRSSVAYLEAGKVSPHASVALDPYARLFGKKVEVVVRIVNVKSGENSEDE